MDAGSEVYNIAVSRDGKLIVSGTRSGELAVWDAQNHEKVTGWKGHSAWVVAVDVSPDGKRIATGSIDEATCVWSLSTGQRLLGPLKYDNSVVVAKFSPDGRLIATATCFGSVRVHDSQNGRLLVDVPIRVTDSLNQSLVWVSNGKNLFALSSGGKINYLDMSSTRTTLSSWSIQSSNPEPGCIALAGNDSFIAISAGSSVSFWDTTTHEQIGSIINHTHDVVSLAISANYELVIGGGKLVTLRNIHDVLPSSYCEVSALARKIVVRDSFLTTNHFDCNRCTLSGNSSA